MVVLLRLALVPLNAVLGHIAFVATGSPTDAVGNLLPTWEMGQTGGSNCLEEPAFAAWADHEGLDLGLGLIANARALQALSDSICVLDGSAAFGCGGWPAVVADGLCRAGE